MRPPEAEIILPTRKPSLLSPAFNAIQEHEQLRKFTKSLRRKWAMGVFLRMPNSLTIPCIDNTALTRCMGRIPLSSRSSVGLVRRGVVAIWCTPLLSTFVSLIDALQPLLTWGVTIQDSFADVREKGMEPLLQSVLPPS